MKVLENDIYKFFQTEHTQTGEVIYVLQVKPDIKEKWFFIKRRATSKGGYYSSQWKGFVFKKEIDVKDIEYILSDFYNKEYEYIRKAEKSRLKKIGRESRLDKKYPASKYPYLYEKEDSGLTDDKYKSAVSEALDNAIYEVLVYDENYPADRIAFIIDEAGYEVPEDIIAFAKEQTQKKAEQLVGGKADGKSLLDIAAKHGVLLNEVAKEFKRGLKVEAEHTKSPNKQSEIAKDHLIESWNYYTYLLEAEKKMEEQTPDKSIIVRKLYEYKPEEAAKKFTDDRSTWKKLLNEVKISQEVYTMLDSIRVGETGSVKIQRANLKEVLSSYTFFRML
jgi:hypothetical protein